MTQLRRRFLIIDEQICGIYNNLHAIKRVCAIERHYMVFSLVWLVLQNCVSLVQLLINCSTINLVIVCCTKCVPEEQKL